MLKITIRGLLMHKARLAMSCLAVLLSVAFVAGTLMFTQTISGISAELNGSTTPDVTVTAPQAGTGNAANEAARQAAQGNGGTVPDTVLARVRAVPGVKAAIGDITVQNVTLTDALNHKIDAAPALGMSGLIKTTVPVLAGNWYESGRSPVRLGSGQAPRGPGEVVLDRDSMDKSHLKIGDVIRVVAVPGTFQARISGVADFRTVSSGNTRAYFDTATAERYLLGKPGVLTSIRADAASGVTAQALRARIAAVLGGDASTLDKDQTGNDGPPGVGDTVGTLGALMLGFAAVAVLVGGFLIFNTFSMLVAARTRELALLRALGASRRQVNRSVRLEALALGILGSTLGLLAGIGLATGLRQVMVAIGMNLKHTSLAFSAATPLTAYGVGVVVTLLAAHLPARRAGRIPPMAALREASLPPAASARSRTVAGPVLLFASVLFLAIGGLATALGALLSLAAFVVLSPVLVRLTIPVLAAAYTRLFGPIGTLSKQNALRHPRRTGATAGALMIGITLATVVSITAASSNASMTARIDRELGADILIGAQHGEAHFGPEVADAARRVPGVGKIVRERVTPATLTAGGRPGDVDRIYGVDPGFPDVIHETYTAGSASYALSHGQIVMVDAVAKDLGLSVGSHVTLRTPGGTPTTLTVGAVQKQVPGGTSLSGRDRFAPTVGIDLLARLAPASADDRLYVSAAKGADTKKVGSALKSALTGYPQVTVQDHAAYKAFERRQTSEVLALVYGLLALAIVIAVLGVINTLALSVTERTREIGLLRAIGTSRDQVSHMIQLESVLIAAFGAVLGLVLGLAWGVAFHYSAGASQSVLAIPWLMLGATIVAAVAVGVTAALLPAVRATRLDILDAIATT